MPINGLAEALLQVFKQDISEYDFQLWSDSAQLKKLIEDSVYVYGLMMGIPSHKILYPTNTLIQQSYLSMIIVNFTQQLLGSVFKHSKMRGQDLNMFNTFGRKYVYQCAEWGTTKNSELAHSLYTKFMDGIAKYDGYVYAHNESPINGDNPWYGTPLDVLQALYDLAEGYCYWMCLLWASITQTTKYGYADIPNVYDRLKLPMASLIENISKHFVLANLIDGNVLVILQDVPGTISKYYKMNMVQDITQTWKSLNDILNVPQFM